MFNTIDYQIIWDDERFFKWFEYRPYDTDYVKYAEHSPHLVATAHKIEDVFYAFANARSYFLNAGSDNYGELYDNDDVSKRFGKAQFINSAILEYSICLDLSWQVIWANIQPSSLENLAKLKYIEMEKLCNRESLKTMLNQAISLGGLNSEHAKALKKIMEDFDDSEEVKQLRQIYNTLKHRGTFMYEGLGEDDGQMKVRVNGKGIKVLSRKTYSFSELENMLYNYHNSFVDYFEKIIKVTMPKDFDKKTVNAEDYFNMIIKLKSIQDAM